MLNERQDGPPDGYITTAEACKRLSISDRTLRRRVERGEIEGEHIPRPQGSILYVKLPQDAATDAASGGEDVSDQEPPPGGTTRPEAAPVAAEALTVVLETVVALVADIRTLERENGTLRAERDAAAARAADLAAELERERRRSWWRWW